MNSIIKIILNRNFILVFAVIMGMFIGDYSMYIKEYTIYILAITMLFSTTGIDSKALLPIKKLFKPMLVGTVLNYFVFGAIVLILAWFLMPSKDVPYIVVRDNVVMALTVDDAFATALTVAVRLECAVVTLDQATLNQLLRTQSV